MEREEAGKYKTAKEVIKALALRVILLFLLKNAQTIFHVYTLKQTYNYLVVISLT